MTDLEIFAEWHEKSLAKHIITKNAQAGAIIEFAKYYHKKQLSINIVTCSNFKNRLPDVRKANNTK
tara:strand:- start:1570 stop:1767 length:198 start_codon:yes stop_codon:yes gene_type:complete